MELFKLVNWNERTQFFIVCLEFSVFGCSLNDLL